MFHTSEFNYVGTFQYIIKYVLPKHIRWLQGKFIFKRGWSVLLGRNLRQECMTNSFLC